MPDNSKISVVLPCYNHAQFLEERIKSVLAQTYPVDQIVFLDDASTDGSPEIAKKLLEGYPGRVDYCINSINSGSPFGQWNKGVRLAKYDLVWIAETDDSCDPSLIETIYSAMISSSAVLGYAQSRYTGVDGKDLGSALSYTDIFWPQDFGHSFSMDGAQFVWHYMTALNVIPNASAVLFRKHAYVSAGKANGAMRYCGDWDMWSRVCAQGRVAFVSDELNFFRCHASTSRAVGYTPQVAAEYFACRLHACGGRGTGGYSSLSLINLIMGLLDPRGRWQWHKLIRSLNLESFKEAKIRYQELPNFPALSIRVWRTLYILIVLDTVKIRLVSPPKKLSRAISRIRCLMLRDS